MPGTVNLAHYTGLLKSWALEENLLLKISLNQYNFSLNSKYFLCAHQ